MYKENCPEINMKFVYLNKNNQDVEVVHSKTNPARRYNKANYIKLYEEAHVKASDVLKLHREICPNANSVVIFSLDGVQEANSSNTSMDVFCLKFKNCRNVYPLRLIRPNDKFKYDEQQEIESVINDIKEADIDIDTAVFDKPKRSVVKNVKSHAARHPCEYCECAAINYIDDTLTKTKLTWPPVTMNGRPRTITAIRRIVNSIEEGDDNLTTNDLKGIKGRSVLLDLENFDFIMDAPCEYMHVVCLGLVKPMLQFTYKIGSNKQRVTNRPRSDPKLFNDLISLVQVFREFSRRCRNLDTSIYKAQEYRNVLLFMWPIVIDNIPEEFKKERQLWLTLVFMIRSCVVPNEEYENVSKDEIIKSCELFYNLYFELFGQTNCTYSLHIVPSHLLKVRGNVPLTERSAFAFESFYSEMKNLFQPGTSSTPKQIISNTLMKRRLEFHKCEKSILYTKESEKKSMENNSLIYTYSNNTHEFFVITDINGEEFTCKRQGKFEYKSPLLPNLNWNTVGVCRKGPIGSETFNIQKNEIKGKAMCVMNMLITCSINVLLEVFKKMRIFSSFHFLLVT